MPNGRSGGFILETAQLRRVIEGMADNAVVGTLVDTSSTPAVQPASAAEIARVMQDNPSERVAVEEQDRIFYIIHLRNEPSPIWLGIGASSPIFAQLQQRHNQWKREHPDWAGWIGF